MRIYLRYGLAAIGLICLGFMSRPHKMTIYLIGDSTMSQKKITAYPETGWGMVFAKFIDTSNTEIFNKAQNGRSTQSFMDEGRWKQVVDSLREGDIVLIQFGHNDEVQTKPQSTSKKVFKKNLSKYVDDTRRKHAIPVLITPAARRSFSADGKLLDTHQAYSEFVREVAKRKKVNLIELDRSSQQLLISLGPEYSKWLFNHLKPGQHPNYPGGKADDTHFSEFGARKMAEIVYAQLKAQNPGNINDHFFKAKPKK